MAYVGFEGIKKAAAADGARNPGAVAASIGRKKYGAARMVAAAAYGRKHPGKKPLLAPKKG